MKVFRVISTAAIAALLGVNIFVGFSIFNLNSQLATAGAAVNSSADASYVLPVTQADYLPALDASVGPIQIDARAALVLDVKTGRFLYQKEINQRLPIASLTKVMTAIVVWENLEPNAIVTVKPSAVKVDRERQDLYKGEQISVHSLMQLMLIRSSNDASYALRDYMADQELDLIKLMNQKARELGMRNTHFTDPAGLDDRAYSTASDMVKAVVYALRYDPIWNASRQPQATIESADGKFTHQVTSTDQLLGVLNGIVGGKTGYTEGALGCMILIVDIPKHDDKIIAVVLGSKERFTAMRELVEWTQKAHRWK